jgi:hypothetical protein
MAVPQFTYTGKPMTYEQAQAQASQQLDPLYQQAVQNVNNQKYLSDVQAGQVAAARGLAHSGLAADQLNKIAIGAQGQIKDLNASRATQIAQKATDLVNQDKQYDLQNRSQFYNEWLGQQNLANNERDFNYQQSRDKVSDNQWQTQFDYNKGIDTRNYNYQVGRDQVSDQRYNTEWQNTLAQQKLAEEWKQRQWNQMSPAEKAQMELQYQYSKKLKGSGGNGGQTTAAKTQTAQSIIDEYLKSIQDDLTKKMSASSPKANPSATSGLMSQPGSYWYARGYGSQYLPK